MIKKYIRFLVRHLLKFFLLFPLEKNKIVFSSFNGEQYSCNPKYLSIYIRKNSPGACKLVWVYNGRWQTLVCDKQVKRFSLLFFYHILTAGVLIDNMGYPSYLPKRNGQIVINTWHGGGAYKKCSRDAIGYDDIEWGSMQYRARCTDVILSSCKAFSEQIPDIFPGFRGNIMECGLPRNDIFFNKAGIDMIRKQVREKLSIEQALVVLYAPTFRGSSELPETWSIQFELEQVRHAFEMRFQKEFAFLIRMHPKQKDSNLFNGGYINASSYPDVQELLCITDVLITDYSSIVWDFALTGNPCFLYTPDLECYSRGFYVHPGEFPGILCKTQEELIESIVTFDEASYQERINSHWKAMGSFEHGNACAQVGDFLCHAKFAEVSGKGNHK